MKSLALVGFAALALAACAPSSAATAVSTATAAVAARSSSPVVAPSATARPPASPTVPPAAPTKPAAVPAGPRKVALQVADRFKTGRLEQPRELMLPGGFNVSVFANGMAGPRFMALGPEGMLYVTGISGGVVYAMRDRGGTADELRTWARGLNAPHGIVVHDSYLYVGEQNKVTRFKIGPNGDRAGEAEIVVPDLPTNAGHRTRTIGFGPDGKLYVAVGSSCNVCEETDPRRAAISVYDGSGGSGRIFARGLRNAVGFVWRPGSPQIWATNNGRDNLGDDAPPETVYLLKDGMDAGWPRCNPPGQPDPQLGSASSCQGVEPPAVTMPAHMAPLGLRFYDGAAFPAEYRGDLFVAVHGSWNRSTPVGYKVVRVPFRGGDKPAGPAEDFLSGFLDADGRAWARPVDVLVAPDGALLVTDDDGGAMFRVTYTAGA